MNSEPLVAVEAKPAHLSLTLIFNALAIALGMLTQVSNTIPLSPKYAAWIATAIAAINFGLRFRTSQPLTMSMAPTVKCIPAPSAEARANS